MYPQAMIARGRQAILFDVHSGQPWSPAFLDRANAYLEAATPLEILAWTLDTYHGGLTIGSAFGASGMALIDMALKLQQDVDIFYIDTGFFFEETLDLIERAQRHYGRRFRRVAPALTVQEQADSHGPELYRRNPDQCCHMRKVLPLEEALAGRTAWITALRRDQSPTRARTPIVQWNGRHRLVKIAPLANWSETDVWLYIHKQGVPYNELHDQDYPSIGCWPAAARSSRARTCGPGAGQARPRPNAACIGLPRPQTSRDDAILPGLSEPEWPRAASSSAGHGGRAEGERASGRRRRCDRGGAGAHPGAGRPGRR